MTAIGAPVVSGDAPTEPEASGGVKGIEPTYRRQGFPRAGLG